MKKIIILLFYFIFISHLYAGKGKIVFENKYKQRILIKIETTNNKKYKKIISPKDKWELKLSSKVGSPDIKDMWVQFPKNDLFVVDKHKMKGSTLDHRKWTRNINVKNNQTSTVKIFYNEDINRFEREVWRNNKKQEDRFKHLGNITKTEIMFKNISPYTITLRIMLTGSLKWTNIELEPNSIYFLQPGTKNNITKNLDHMVLEFAKLKELEKNNITSEKRWWPNTIRNQKNESTIVYIDFDKISGKFIRYAIRKGIIKESLKTNKGIRFSESYLKLPTRPKTRMVNIETEIAKLYGNIALLETEKTSQQALKASTKWVLDKTMFAALGLSNMAQKAATGALSLINIKNAELSGTIKDLFSGNMPRLLIDCEIAGKDKTFDLQFNFKQPDNLDTISKEISTQTDSTLKEPIQDIEPGADIETAEA
ncbi:MAG: hypothetical protein SZ59_C0005G0023 [candidate division TM6 bacterium GW2011_GWF2_28_16]|nr:MAG: hypothetical protein SZ59_C0005G0023 [candidate division TM6 bacterium GW2011_GWF2_28_16]